MWGRDGRTADDLMGPLFGRPAAAVVAGDVRANENIALTAIHTLFAREHNRIVAALPRALTESVKFATTARTLASVIRLNTGVAVRPNTFKVAAQ
jgi:hypothetical protein